MELGHLLTRSGLTYPEVFSKVYHDSFCQLRSSVSLPWVIYFEAFYLHDVCCMTHSGEVSNTGKYHGKKPDRFSLKDNMDVEKASRLC